MESVSQQDRGRVARVGLEVHAQLATRTKLFCGCRADYGAAPNSQTCPVCLGLPGSLPVLNAAAVDCAVKVTVALDGRLAQRSYFARKNYFYPDVPKNYQITQYDRPLMTAGQLKFVVAGERRRLTITRMHLEEDAGKLLHDDEPPRSRVDLNRAGVPLLEIVTAPDLHDGREARACVEELRRILLYLAVCDGNLQEGSLRCDANVSVVPILAQDRQVGSSGLQVDNEQTDHGWTNDAGSNEPPRGTKIEVKNLNSFRAIQQAVDHEISRQTEVLTAGGRLAAETRGWDAERGRTFFMRSKEQVHDYRYFPDPDLPPLIIDASEIATARSSLPELSRAKLDRYVNEYKLALTDAETLTGTPALAAYFEATLEAIAAVQEDAARLSADRKGEQTSRSQARPAADPAGEWPIHENAKLVAGWILTELLGELNQRDLDLSDFPVTPPELACLLALRQSGALSSSAAREVFAEMVISGRSAADIVHLDGWRLIDDRDELTRIARTVLDHNPDALESYLAGKERVFTFLVGQIMQATDGRAHPDTAREVLRQELTLRQEKGEQNRDC